MLVAPEYTAYQASPHSRVTCAECHVGPGATCHPTRSEIHLKTTHAASECTTCHLPHEWKVTKKETCLTCHPDKTEHNTPGLCKDCHQFRQAANTSAPSP